jgi:dihydrofolate synthase/folylpolyglutamate synthase
MHSEPEFIQRLYRMRTFGIKLGLDRTNALLERLGNPHLAIAAIHIAGTNGKGSVAAMIESVLREAGYRTGLYTSPHLIRLNERMRVDGNPISDEELKELVELVDSHSAAVAREYGDVTFFEFTTALAFEYFRRQRVGIVALETGMGGRLDSTNVVFPLLSVITSIALEHVEHLGSTVPQIAAEKGGIIKEGRPVVCGKLDEEGQAVIGRIARSTGSPVIDAAEWISVRRVSQSIAGQKIKMTSCETDYPPLLLPLLGEHQLENCATAVAALETAAAAASLEIEPKTISAGLSHVNWQARCQVLSEHPPIVLDGGHNPGAARVLSATIHELAGGCPTGLVLGMCGDKDVHRFLKPFRDMVARCWVVPLRNERGIAPAELSAAAAGMGWCVSEMDLADAIADARRWAIEENGLVCIAGSLFLAGEVLALKEEGVLES